MELANENILTIKNKHDKPQKQLYRPQTVHFVLRMDSLEFRLKTESGAPVEPYFLSVSLYDGKSGQKISEDFKTIVDVNGQIPKNQTVSKHIALIIMTFAHNTNVCLQ